MTGLNTTIYRVAGTPTNAQLTYDTSFATLNEAGGTLYRERQVQIGVRLQF